MTNDSTMGTGIKRVRLSRDPGPLATPRVGGITAGIAVLIGVLALTNLRHLRPFGAESDDGKGADAEFSVSGAADV